MRGHPSPAEVRKLATAVMESYVTWRQESAWVATAYERWRVAGSEQRDGAYGTYLGALEREELAAAEYRRRTEQAAARLGRSVTLA